MTQRAILTLAFIVLLFFSSEAQTQKSIHVTGGMIRPVELYGQSFTTGTTLGLQYEETKNRKGIAIQLLYHSIEFKDWEEISITGAIEHLTLGIYYIRKLDLGSRFYGQWGVGVGGVMFKRPSLEYTFMRFNPDGIETRTFEGIKDITFLYRSQFKTGFRPTEKLNLGISLNLDYAPNYLSIDAALLFIPQLEVGFKF